MPPASILNAPGLAYPGTNLPAGVEDTLAVKLALTSFKKVHQQVTLINLPEFDYPLGHVYGDDPAYMKMLMQHFDRDLGMIEDTYRKAGVLDQTLFVITSDHGMTPLRHIVPDSVLDDSVTAAGTTSSETTYSTSGYIWLQNANMAHAVADNVVKKKDAHVQSVYYKVTSSAGGSYVRAGGLSISAQTDSANQYLLQSFLSGNAPDVVAICTERAAFENTSAKTWKGNHGGAAWESQHVPLLIAGPGIAGGTVSHAPARLEDVAPTALALFGIKARGMQGTVLADALRTPSSGQIKAQKALNRTLNPVVAALSAQSQADTYTYIRTKR